MVIKKLKRLISENVTPALVFVLSFFLCACVQMRPSPIPGFPRPYKVHGKWYQPIPDATGFTQKGTASWYGKKFHGRKTANGEIYNMYSMTAAHKTIPLGTWFRVENLENGKSIEVRVNDRGPFIQGRIIDLSYKAATMIDMTGNGTARVKITAISKKQAGAIHSEKPNAFYSIQIGSFAHRKNAENLVSTLENKYKNTHIVPLNGSFKVRVGKFSSLTSADKIKKDLKTAGYSAFTIIE